MLGAVSTNDLHQCKIVFKRFLKHSDQEGSLQPMWDIKGKNIMRALFVVFASGQKWLVLKFFVCLCFILRNNYMQKPMSSPAGLFTIFLFKNKRKPLSLQTTKTASQSLLHVNSWKQSVNLRKQTSEQCLSTKMKARCQKSIIISFECLRKLMTKNPSRFCPIAFKLLIWSCHQFGIF